MDPIGAITSVIQLAELIHNTVVTLAEAEKDEQALASQIQLSAIILSRFVATFEKVLSDTWSSNESDVLKEVADIAEELRLPLQQMNVSIVRILPGSSRFRRWGGRLTWLAYRRRELQSLADQMHKWGGLFNQLMGTLSEGLRTYLLRSGKDHDTKIGSMEDMRSLSRLLQNLAMTSSDSTALPSLEKSIEELMILDIADTLASARFGQKSVLVEYKPYDVDSYNVAAIDEIREQVNRLTHFLKLADPLTTGILRPTGYIHDSEDKYFALLFSLPKSSRFPLLPATGTDNKTIPETLHSIISQEYLKATDTAKISYLPIHPLDERMRIARTVATAVLYIHTCDWVHESIRSHNVLMLRDATVNSDKQLCPRLGSPFVVGFETSRSAEGFSSMVDSGQSKAIRDFNLAIYQHPDRQTLKGDDKARFQKCYDRYSLGVVLLEIGLWTPLEKVEQLCKIKMEDDENVWDTYAKVRAVLIGLAKERLSRMMGTAYQQLVLDCLSEDVQNARSVDDLSNLVVSKLWSMNASLSP